MKIGHIAIWTNDIEKLKDFYTTYFNATSNKKYVNGRKNFESYFLSFDEGCRLEIMQMTTTKSSLEDNDSDYIGLAHFAISVGDKSLVLTLTERLKVDGYKILSEPRITGDGYFESVVCDPDGNRVEITI